MLITIISCKEDEEPIFNLLEDDVYLFSQEQVNEFVARKVTHLRGSLTIFGDDISDLRGLGIISTIEGSLMIGNTQIRNVDVFSNLTRLDERLEISSNYNLENLNGFNQIGSLGGQLKSVQVYDNPKLTTINQFNEFAIFKEGVSIWSNESLTDVDFSGLIEAGVVSIQSNPLLSDLSGFSQLRQVGHLSVANSPVITTLTDLHLELVESLQISGLSNLANLNGLESITELELIYIEGNPLITEIDEFRELTELNGELSLSGNTSLTAVDFNRLNYVGHLHLNETQLEDFTGFSALLEVGGDLSLSSNDRLPDLDDLPVSKIHGTLSLWGNAQITSLEPLTSLDVIGGLRIQRSALANFKGLENVTVLSDVSISDNLQLESLEGLGNLKEVGSNIFLKNSPLLTNLEGLNALEKLGNTLSIYDCSNLTDYCALEQLVADGVKNRTTIERNAYNPTLGDIVRGDCRQ